ncbi:MAG: hypothetical protein KKA26_00285, partial [Nanoarchaeota archaeon]|nr:hypothetical protein [Nanoarchaeota archaeon]
MKVKRGVLSLFLILILLATIIPFALASSVDSEIKKITHYAEEYETGNIDYVRLMLHFSSAREGLNEVLGATGKEMGGIVKEEQIRKVLGEPNEETKWVWVEGEEQDKKLDDYVPVWKKIVFDGKKIQIRMEAYPSIFKKYDHFEDIEGLPEEDSIIYRLHFSTEFKKPKEQIDIQSKIDSIQSLAEAFNSNPTSSNAEELAKESVNAEMIFRNYFEQGSGKCEDVMVSIFGSENQRQGQNVLLNEITFCEGEKFEAILRLEMCDDCEWNYINMDLRFEGRGNFKHPDERRDDKNTRDRYREKDESSLMSETRDLIDQMQSACQQEDFDSLFSYSNQLRAITEAWNEKSNDVWEEIEKEKSNEQPEGNEDPYWWIKQDQLQRQKANDLREQNYNSRKSFYLGLFSGYDKREYYFSQTNFEKRLVQEFKENGEEICNNNIDDNDNDQIDCGDSQCGGQICGAGTTTIEGTVEGENGTTETETTKIKVDYYCISGECQAKEYEIKEKEGF